MANFIALTEVALIKVLARRGWSLREIAAATGCAKRTVARYVGPRERATAMRRFHERRRTEGRPIYPPWYERPSHEEELRREALEAFAEASRTGLRTGVHGAMPKGAWGKRRRPNA